MSDRWNCLCYTILLFNLLIINYLSQAVNAAFINNYSRIVIIIILSYWISLCLSSKQSLICCYFCFAPSNTRFQTLRPFTSSISIQVFIYRFVLTTNFCILFKIIINDATLQNESMAKLFINLQLRTFIWTRFFLNCSRFVLEKRINEIDFHD